MTPSLQLHPIQNEADYRMALKQVENVMDAPVEPDPDSAEGAWLDAMVTLIQAWEHKHYPIDAPTPIEAIKFYMEEHGLTVADMQPYIGPKNRVYEVLKGKRELSLNMIRRLVELGIPAQTLIRC